VQLSAGPDRHLRVGECAFAVAEWQWPLEERHRSEIALNWQRRLGVLPSLFDGTVYLSRDHAVDAGRLTGTLFKTDFKTLLYWRSLPFAASDTVREVNGYALIRSADGCLLFGRQAAGQLNSGRIYPPSGVIDAADIAGNVFSIDASTARELAEETGLKAGDLERGPGYVVAQSGLEVAVGIEWRSRLPAVELRQQILDFLRADATPELDDIVIVASERELTDANVPVPARLLAQAIFSV